MTRRTKHAMTFALIGLLGTLMGQGCPPLFQGSTGGGGGTITPPQPGLSPPTEQPVTTDRTPRPGDVVAIALFDSQTGLIKSRVATGKTGSTRECVDISLSLGDLDSAFIDVVITLVDVANKTNPAAPPLFQTSQPNVVAPAEFGQVTFDQLFGAGQYCPPDFVNQELLITITAFGQPASPSPFVLGTASFVVAPPGGTLSISLASQFPAVAAPNSSPVVVLPAPEPGVTVNDTDQRTTSQLTAEVQGGTPSLSASGPYMVEFFANDASLGQVPATIEINAQNQIVAVARRSVSAVENPADENLTANPARLAPGAKTLRAVVTDSAAVPATATSVVSVTVNSPLSAVGSAIPNGGLVTLTAVASGGLAPYTFAWSQPHNGDLLGSLTEPIATLQPQNTDAPSTAVVTITDNAGNILALRPPPNQLTCPLPTIQTGLVDITTPVNPAVFTLVAQNSAFGGPIAFIWSYSATSPNSGFAPLANGDRGGRVIISQVADTSTLTITGVIASDDGFYQVSLADNCGQAASVSVARLAATSPTVQTIVRQNPLTQLTNNASVVYRVTFSEDVNNVDAGDFTLVDVATALTGESISSVNSIDDRTYDVTVNTGSAGTGDLRLDVIAATATIEDDTGNALGVDFTTGEVYTVDHDPPTVTSIVRQTPAQQLTGAANVVYRVTFSENVNGVSTADFTLVDVSNAITGESITSVSAATGTVIDVTVNTGTTGTGDLRLDVLGSATITDDVGNDLTADFTTGQVYTVDHDPPTVTTIVRQNPAAPATNAPSVTWRVTFNEDVTGVDTGDFTLTTVSGVFFFPPLITGVAPVSASVYDVTASTGLPFLSVPVIRLDVMAATATITDVVTDVPNALNTDFTTGETYTIDQQAPTVVSINRQTPPGQNTNAASVVYRVTFSENVNNVSTADFTLVDVSNAITGESITSVSAASGTVIDVTVNTGSAGTGDLRLDVIVPPATINDDATNALAVNFTTGQVYTVDHDNPTVLSINRQNPAGQNTNLGSVVYRVTFSENVNNVSTADFTLVDVSNALTGESITSVSSATGTVIDVTVDTGSAGTGDLRLDVIAATATITDDQANSLTADFTTGQVYTIDHDNPTVLSINRQNPAGQNTNLGSVVYRVTFSENVNNVDTADFTLVDVSAALTGESITSVSAATGTVIDVTVNTGSAGTGDLRLDVIAAGASITDDFTNALTADFTAGQVYTVDHDNPTVLSINRQTPAGQNTNAASVVWRVTFSENVNNVDTGDFTLVDVSAAITGESITSVSAASGTTIDVTVNTGTAGTGDLRLDVIAAGATIADNFTNALTADFTTGQVYTIDHTAPTVLSVSAVDDNNIDVTFSEPVNTAQAETAANYTISGAGIGDLDANPQSVADQGGNTFRLHWPNSQSGTPGGAFTITVANVNDLNGNVIDPGGNSGSNNFPP